MIYNLKTLKPEVCVFIISIFSNLIIFLQNKLLINQPANINAINFNHNGSLVVAGSSDGMIRIFGIPQLFIQSFDLRP